MAEEEGGMGDGGREAGGRGQGGGGGQRVAETEKAKGGTGGMFSWRFTTRRCSGSQKHLQLTPSHTHTHTQFAVHIVPFI